MIVYRNCYLYRCGNDIIISTSSNLDSARKINAKKLGYTHDKKGLKSVQDEEGNYFYLADDCQEIQ